jgi:hypothetical protein
MPRAIAYACSTDVGFLREPVRIPDVLSEPEIQLLFGWLTWERIHDL